MARIRTIKPDFFRHEALQDLEIANPGMYPMMVFAALWGHCDSKGRFEWKPRMLKLDILPFIPFDMAKTLEILERGKMLHRYCVGGKEYGLVSTFENHQRLSGKEATEGEKYPEPTSEQMVKQSGSVGEIPESQEGKGREGKRKGMDVNAELSARRVLAVQVFDFWRVTLGHDRAVMDAKRTKVIESRLKDGYTVDQLCNAVKGCSLSPFHMGDNDRGCKYDGLELILRDAEKVDQFIEFFNSPPKPKPAIPGKPATGRQANIDNYAAQAAAAREKYEPSSTAANERDITGQCKVIA